MAKYTTYLDDVPITLEAPVANALTKGTSEERPDPDKAVANVFETIRMLVEFTGRKLGPTLRGTGAAFEMNFAVRADNTGGVMVSEDAQTGQFQCSVKFPPVRPARPSGGTKALPQKGQGPTS